MYHYSDVKMNTMASQITSLTIVYSALYLGADQRKQQSSVSLAFVRGIHRWPVNSPQKGPVTRKMFPFDDVIMGCSHSGCLDLEMYCSVSPWCDNNCCNIRRHLLLLLTALLSTICLTKLRLVFVELLSLKLYSVRHNHLMLIFRKT